MGLKEEVATDPLGRGYAGMTDEQVATDLNTEYRQRNRTTMTGREVSNEIADAEYDVLTVDQKTQVISLTTSNDLDPFGFGANVIKDIFTNTSSTSAALAAARVETISRAVELGLGTVKPGQVEEVRRA